MQKIPGSGVQWKKKISLQMDIKEKNNETNKNANM